MRWAAEWCEGQFGIECEDGLEHSVCVKTGTARKEKSEARLLDQATENLLKALKKKMVKKQGRVDYAKLRKDGYSERFLAKLENA